MSNTGPKQKTASSTATIWYVGIFIAVILLFIFAIWKHITILNSQFDYNKDSLISNSKQTTNPLKDIEADSTGIHQLPEEDLARFNDHIDYLATTVEREVKRTQDNNQYDIDRINTFLAIGIGLLAIIGGLLPIFVNYSSKEDLEKRMKAYESGSTTITQAANEAKKDAEQAKNDAESAKAQAEATVKRITELDGKIKKLTDALAPIKDEVKNVKETTKKIPYIDLLVLQNAVAKLTSTDALKLFIGANRYSVVSGFLQNLILAMDSFSERPFADNDNFDESYFRNIVAELKLALKLGPIRRIPDGRSFQSKIDETVLKLEEFDKIEKKDFRAQLQEVSKTIGELKQLIDGKSS